MSNEHRHEIDEIASDVDDLKNLVEEIEDDTPPGVSRHSINSLKHALEDASDAADDLENDADSSARTTDG